MKTFILTLLILSLTHASPPSGFHISWSASGGIYIQWADIASTLPLGSGNPRCNIDASSSKSTFQANSTTYNDTCTRIECTTWSGWLHTAEIPASIAASAEYFTYNCGDDVNGFSNDILARGRAEKENEPVEFYFVGDVGSYLDSIHVEKIMQRAIFGNNNASHNKPSIDFIHMAGDIVYSNGNQTLWDYFFQVWEPVLQAVPTLFTPGNHDGYWVYGNNYDLPYSYETGGGESGNAYSLRLPGPGPGVFFESGHPGVPDQNSTSAWWSVGFGGIRMIATSGMHEWHEGSDQYKWLEAELQKANTKEAREKEPWLIVTNHYPIYCTINDCFCGNYTSAAKEEACEPAEDGNWIPGVYEVNGIRMKEVFEPLLLKYDVDLFLAGHEHCYERSLPVRNFAVQSKNDIKGRGARFEDPGDPIHVMVGTGGGDPDTHWRGQGDFAWSSIRSDGLWSDLKPFGFTRFVLSPDRSEMYGEYLNVNPAGIAQVLDSFTVVKTDIAGRENVEVEYDFEEDAIEAIDI